AGTTTGFSFGDASDEMGNYGWLTSNSQETTHPIGQKKPNPWGLYDMYGNVWEWCLDWDGRRSSDRSVPVTDPTGPASGSLRVFRGGGWKSSPRNCHPDNRGKLAEVYRGNTLGFRVIRTLARPVSKPSKAVATVVNSIGMRFVKIPSGKFNIGGKKDGPQVTLSRPFQMGQYEVTQEQYQKVMGTNPSRFSGPQNPVERVNWYDAVDFCRKLSELPEEKKLAYVYRLPTQAEWEYAGRAGATTVFSFGDSDAELGMYAWYSKNSGFTTHPVGEKNPNVWGLHDMHGNVQEWCQDNVMKYSSGVVDPIGNAASKFRCLRGGMWLWGSDYHRFTHCPGIRPNDRDRSGTTGFRVVRTHVE
ncbi:MAG: formylglycine-generating enzyme family protein, partial [Planctomycetaceae bacterium]|nr:formylglycine-generating enzyme family protein [Planctomycetaceae bacterium]